MYTRPRAVASVTPGLPPPAPGALVRPRKARQQTRSGGFTLIEVMVALTVVAITLAAGLKAAGALTQNTERLNSITMAQWCADNQLTNLRLNGQFPGVGDSDFKCTQLGHTFAGQLTIRPTPNPNFRRVDANIQDEAGRSIVTLSTILTKFGERSTP